MIDPRVPIRCRLPSPPADRKGGTHFRYRAREIKIQCDVCEKAHIAVICCADEAALYIACDKEIHRANKLASKHQRLQLDRALFCQDCDESIHVHGTRYANHQHYLATGIHVALNTIYNKDSNDNNEPPSKAPAITTDSATKAPATQVISSFINSAWDVDGFHQLLDHETSHKGSPVGFGELDWFVDIDIFDGQMPKGIQTVAQQASNIVANVSFPPRKFTASYTLVSFLLLSTAALPCLLIGATLVSSPLHKSATRYGLA
ncbi:hypothetical protein ZIOFF_008370 [Zingiber officinale]|uniref:B box-type domain-containing protein n=1 Tax=Zingiber officinale TaxID=94328 RepID=A0A8J5HSK7_ZINOF|nr:hypothetical protein ZIOFF_008370 [Zingiber officinale]